MSRRTGIVKDSRYLQHASGFSYPESPERLASVYEMLDNPHMSWKYVDIEPRAASHDEIAYVHTSSYIHYIADTAGKNCVFLDSDTIADAETYDIAKLAVGGLMNAIDSVMTGEVDNAFAFVRPPGHHAGPGNAAGFCIFNNVAVGAMHAIKKHGLKKILIVDWDLHHGNGTQKIFYSDRRVLYFSTHQYPYYPGTGGLQEIGEGQALGYTVNVPLRRGAVNGTFISAFRKILEPIALAYKPELILVSAGFDTYYQDPLGGMRVTPEGFAAMARVLLNIAVDLAVVRDDQFPSAVGHGLGGLFGQVDDGQPTVAQVNFAIRCSPVTLAIRAPMPHQTQNDSRARFFGWSLYPNLTVNSAHE